MPRRKPYKGILSEPILAMQKGDPAAQVALVTRLLALFDHYEIPTDTTDAIWLLTIKLAVDHVPGFRVRRLSGRKGTEVQAVRDLIMFARVMSARGAMPNRPYRALIKEVAKANGWPHERADIDTWHTRFFLLRKAGSRERRRAIEVGLPAFLLG